MIIKMKTKVLGLAIAAISITSFSLSAQNNDSTTPCCDKAKKECKNKPGNADCSRQKPYCNPFEGLNLNDMQKQQLKALQEKNCAERAEKCKAAKGQKKAECEKRAKECREAKRANLKEIKKIVGEANYEIFLENIVIDSQQKAPRGMKHMKMNKCPKNNGAKCPKSSK